LRFIRHFFLPLQKFSEANHYEDIASEILPDTGSCLSAADFGLYLLLFPE
jgi:hypothetical protein